MSMDMGKNVFCICIVLDKDMSMKYFVPITNR
jgi:hypothetical protein